MAMKRRKNNGPCASKVAALAAEHEVMTGLGANAEAQETDGDERKGRGVKKHRKKRKLPSGRMEMEEKSAKMDLATEREKTF